MRDYLSERRNKVLSFFKGKLFSFVLVGIIGLLGYIIRIRNLSLMIDVTTGKYVPIDPDATGILRYVLEIAKTGSFPAVDALRYHPFGFSNLGEFSVLSYFIFYLHKFLSFFSSSLTLEKVDVLYPPITFFASLFIFFLLVRRLFDKRVALLASAFLAFVPSYLFRTLAGVSDKEALAMLFMFISYYFFILYFQSHSFSRSVVFGIFSGIFTGLTGLVWGGVISIFVIFGAFAFFEILLEKFGEKEFAGYTAWLVTTLLVLNLFSGGRFPIQNFFTSFTSLVMLFSFLVGLIYYILYVRKVLKLPERIMFRYPPTFFSAFLSLVVGFFFSLVIFGTSFFSNKLFDLFIDLTSPFARTRWALTVAESRQPYFVDIISQVNWVLILLFLFGALLLFYFIVQPVGKRDSLWLSGYFVFFLFAFVFNRYRAGTILDGASPFSIFLYLGSILSFILVVVVGIFYLYSKDRTHYRTIQKTNRNYIFALIFAFFMIIAARSAIRLIFVFTPVVTILASFFIISSYDFSNRLRDYKFIFSSIFFSTWLFLGFFRLTHSSGGTFYALLGSLVLGSLFSYFVLNYVHADVKNVYFALGFIVLIVLLLFWPFGSSIRSISPLSNVPFISQNGILVEFYAISRAQAGGAGPTYSQQWQRAGEWIRENTPPDAVFAHWWDYGYLVQFGGQRATLSDGGNSRGAINYFMGRHFLTAKSETEALQLFRANNVTHALIIKDEINKYGAFSSIGSDVNYDRYAFINTFTHNPQPQETRDGFAYIYQGSTPLDDPLVYNGVVYPAGSAGIAGFFLPLRIENNTVVGIDQPQAIISYQSRTATVPLGCVYFEGNLQHFQDAPLNGCLRLIPTILESNQVNPIGAALYLPPRVADTLFSRLFLFDEELEHFKKVYDDSDRNPLAIFVRNGGGSFLIGSLKIWELSYPDDLFVPPEFYGTALPDPRVDIPLR